MGLAERRATLAVREGEVEREAEKRESDMRQAVATQAIQRQ